MKDKKEILNRIDFVTKLAKRYWNNGMDIYKAIDKAQEKYKKIEKSKYEK